MFKADRTNDVSEWDGDDGGALEAGTASSARGRAMEDSGSRRSFMEIVGEPGGTRDDLCLCSWVERKHSVVSFHLAQIWPLSVLTFNCHHCGTENTAETPPRGLSSVELTSALLVSSSLDRPHCRLWLGSWSAVRKTGTLSPPSAVP